MSATKHIFVSYARRDSELIDRIVLALRGAGYDVWIDRGGILGARLWKQEIVAAIRESTAFVIALSPHSVVSRDVRKELDLSEAYRKQVVPLRIVATEIPDEMQYQIAGLQFVDWYDLDFERGIEELRRTLDGLHVERLDTFVRVAEPPIPASAIWRTPPAILGAAGLVAAVATYAVSMVDSGAKDAPSSLTGLMPASVLGVEGVGFLNLALIATLASLGMLSSRWKSIRPAIFGLVAFLMLAVPVAMWRHQYITAGLVAITTAVVCAWWGWKSRKGAGTGSGIAYASILLGSALLGDTAQYVLNHEPAGGSIIGVTPFEVMDDDELRVRQADHSNKLRQKLSAVFHQAGLNVVPSLFDQNSLDDWSFDNWRTHKASEVEPHLMLRTSLNRCGRRGRNLDAEEPTSYIWLAEPFDRNFEPFADVVRASGPDTRVLSLRVAFELLTAVHPFELTAAQQREARRVIVQGIRSVALDRRMMTQAETAKTLLAGPLREDEPIRALLDSFNSGDSPCDEAAAMSRGAHGANASSYSAGASPQSASDAGL